MDLFGSKEAGSKGGKARAKRLTPEQRSAIARQGALAKWKSGDVPTAVCGSPDRPLVIGSAQIQCYVLADGTRVLAQHTFLQALGRHPKANVRGEEHAPPILQGKAINPYVSAEILEKSKPIRFMTPSGSIASGYRAELLPDVCDVYLKARADGVLPYNQQHVAKQAEILVRGLARVGIIALVDEVTGYQDFRARNELAKILEAYVTEELQAWVKTFPMKFYQGIFRLWGLPFDPKKPILKRPGFVGGLTNDLIYERLAPGVLPVVEALNPKNEKGNRSHRHHQHLTRDFGHPKLQSHLAAVIALMDVSDRKDDFMAKMNKALPKYRPMPLFEPVASKPDALD